MREHPAAAADSASPEPTGSAGPYESTTAKGDRFEGVVFDLLGELLESGGLPYRPEACALSSKVPLYSHRRKKDIVFDLVLDVWAPSADRAAERPTHRVVVECKDLSRSVPVDDVEEFHSKLEQLEGAHVKGLICSTSGFSQSALAVARSLGIGLLRYFGPGQSKWVLRRPPSRSPHQKAPNALAALRALTDPGYRSDVLDVYGCVERPDGLAFSASMGRLVEDLVWKGRRRGGITDEERAVRHKRPSARPPRPPYLPKNDIDGAAWSALERAGYGRAPDGHYVRPVPLEAVCEAEAERSGLVVRRVREVPLDPAGHAVLGSVTFDPPVITLYEDPRSDPSGSPLDEGEYGRRRFTLAHELGHLLLGHGEHLVREYFQSSDRFSQGLESVESREVRSLEYQANRFASSLLLPEAPLREAFFVARAAAGITRSHHGWLYVDAQPCNQEAYYEVTDRLKRQFAVSRTAVRIRLKELGLLVEP